MSLKIAAVADIHSPRYIPLLAASIAKLRSESTKIDLILLAGDVVERNDVASLNVVVNILSRLTNKLGASPPMVAVFGNEEYPGYEHVYRKLYPQIMWINDELRVLSIDELTLCIVGSRGAILKPTAWQQKHVPNAEVMYRARVEKIRGLLRKCRDYNISILVTHYTSTFATVEGEDPRIHKFLGYPIIETLNDDEKPCLAIHGHAHNSVRTHAVVNNVPIYNVSIPATKCVTIITLNTHMYL